MSDFMSLPYDKPADNCVAFMRISVSDIDRAEKFYSTVFGWVFQSKRYQSTISVFKTGGQVMGSLHEHKDAGTKAPAVLNYIKVASVEETLKKVVEAGGKVVEEKWTEGNHTDMGTFEDTEGNLVGLLHWLM
ncbi:hypothetical protein M407DRAFT_25960 [Tulasnella calospora MUT 4182]|uniref:VOC domain-containing protein n=1 Tax=Tulasnella calospora MUT 4182 TaxID=1051891 RepID=A0A0C3Q5Y6_9AGAM|nr:hypothetical protein M407DRAFT_25960 [Tulasnella calospora MUT 4182]